MHIDAGVYITEPTGLSRLSEQSIDKYITRDVSYAELTSKWLMATSPVEMPALWLIRDVFITEYF